MTIDSTRFNYFDASLISKSDLKLLEKADLAFDRMLKEIAILGEYQEQNKLHLVEFALSKRTRKVLNELKHREIQFTTQYKALLEYIEEQEAAAAGGAATDTVDIGGNILKLINKFHTDNKRSIDTLSGEEKFKDFVPKNIGAEPSMWQKAKAKLQGVASGDGNVIVKVLTAIVSSAMAKAEKFFSGLKGDLATAWKGGGTEVDSQGNPIIDPATGQPKKTADGVAGVFQYAMTTFGPSMTTVERGADGQLTYKKDTEATGFLDWLRKFVERNPKWTNIIIGFITNIAKLIAFPFGGPMSSLIAGAVVGLILRTLVGRLKGESWAQAFKQAAIVVGLSLIAGAVFKGLVAWIRGGGFFAGIKSYFVGGDPVAAAKAAVDAKTDAATTSVSTGFVKVSTADIDKLMVKGTRGGSTQLYDIVRQNPQLYKAFKDKAMDSVSGGDLKTFINVADKEELATIINNAGGISKQTFLTATAKAARAAARSAEIGEYVSSRSRAAVGDLVKTVDSFELSKLGDTIPNEAWREAGMRVPTLPQGVLNGLIKSAQQGDQDSLSKLAILFKNSGNEMVNDFEFKDLPAVSQKLIRGIMSGKPEFLSPAELKASIASAQADTAVQQKAAQAAQATMKAGADAVNAANAAATTAISPRYNWQPGTANQIAKSLGLGDKVAAYNLDKFGRVTSILNPQTREYVPVPTDMITSQDQLLKPGFGIKESSYKKMMKNIYL